jgi:C1A family cysteine protease
MAQQSHGYGWIPDLPDQRDHLYAAPIVDPQDLPSGVDLRSHCPPVYDQGQLGSCTANAIAGAYQFCEMKEGAANDFVPSRLFIYYNERVIEHTVASDSGAQIRDGIKSVANQGVCPEDLWPYNIANFAERPPANCYQVALQNKVTLYQRLAQNIYQMKACLASGFPFVFGFTVYDSFESPDVAKTGIVPMPSSDESVLGGHAVVAVGYDDSQQSFIVRNSWGSGWGLQGYFMMPYAYLTQAHPVLASDFWTIRVVSTNPTPSRNPTPDQS